MSNLKPFYELNLPTAEFLNSGFELKDFSDQNSNITAVKVYNPLTVFKKEIINFFSTNNLKFPLCQIFCAKPGDGTLIHMDGSYNSENKVIGTPSFAINWIINGTDSEMTWYEPNIEKSKMVYPEGKWPFRIWENESDLTVAAKATITNPTLIRIDVPHKVTNFGSTIRWAVSLRFPYNKGSWDDIVNQLDNIIKK